MVTEHKIFSHNWVVEDAHYKSQVLSLKDGVVKLGFYDEVRKFHCSCIFVVFNEQAKKIVDAICAPNI